MWSQSRLCGGCCRTACMPDGPSLGSRCLVGTCRRQIHRTHSQVQSGTALVKSRHLQQRQPAQGSRQPGSGPVSSCFQGRPERGKESTCCMYELQDMVTSVAMGMQELNPICHAPRTQHTWHGDAPRPYTASGLPYVPLPHFSATSCRLVGSYLVPQPAGM